MRGFKIYAVPVAKDRFRKVLRGAMLNYTPESYSALVVASCVLASATGFVLQMFGVGYAYIPLPIATYAAMVAYPFLRARARSARIDVKLPHAVTYMQAFCDVLPLYDVFLTVYREKELYGEVSEEFGFVVRDVELLGYDILTAMKRLASETPSQSLAEFLEGLVVAFESGESLKSYMATKIRHMRGIAARQSELNLKTLEILAEVYVVLFVALPIFLIVTIYAMNFAGKGVGWEYYAYLHLFLPLGSVAMIAVIDTLNVKEDLSVARIVRRGSVFPRSIVSDTVRSRIRRKRRFRNPLKLFAEAVRRDYYRSLVLSCAAPVFLLYDGFRYPESRVAAAIVAFCIPLAIAFEYRAWLVRRVEKDIPNFLREILNLKDVGMPLHEVIRMIKESKIGVLGREIRLAHAGMEWGETVVDALLEIVNRIGTASVRRVITLLINASRATENVREVLIATIEDFEFGLKLKSDRFVSGFTYLFVVYLSFFIFLYTVYTLNTSFASSFSKLGGASVDVGLVYRILLVLAVTSGIIAGQMEKGHVLHGLKHVCIFATSSLLLLEFAVGGG